MVALNRVAIEAYLAEPNPTQPIALVFGPDAGLVSERVRAILRATVEDLKAAIANRGNTVVAIGHQPDCSAIVFALTGRERVFAPGAVHEIQLDDAGSTESAT